MVIIAEVEDPTHKVNPLQIGFVAKVESPIVEDLNDFPSKIGGKPIWLNPTSIPSYDELKCEFCQDPMALLMQISTPEDEPPEAYHRCIYVFCCKKGECHTANRGKCFRVLRQQLPEDTPYYEEEKSEAESEDDSNKPEFEIGYNIAPPRPYDPQYLPKICELCNLRAPAVCSGCKSVRYCSKKHQIMHWKQGVHSRLCSSVTSKPDKQPLDPVTRTHLTDFDKQWISLLGFPEYEMISEEEPNEEEAKKIMMEEVKTMMETLKLNTPSDSQELVKPKSANEIEEEYENSEVDVDKAFLRFQKRITRAPAQVLRYARVGYETSHEPLLVNDLPGNQPPTDLPPCIYCGEHRNFEFQIMPQLLSYLNLDNVANDALDYGTILVYSCSRNCQPKKEDGKAVGYMFELPYIQYFSRHSMTDRLKREE